MMGNPRAQTTRRRLAGRVGESQKGIEARMTCQSVRTFDGCSSLSSSVFSSPRNVSPPDSARPGSVLRSLSFSTSSRSAIPRACRSGPRWSSPHAPGLSNVALPARVGVPIPARSGGSRSCAPPSDRHGHAGGHRPPASTAVGNARPSDLSDTGVRGGPDVGAARSASGCRCDQRGSDHRRSRRIGGRPLGGRPRRFEAALDEAETPDAWFGLALASWWLGENHACVDACGRAYALFRRAGDVEHAAQCAVWLAIT